MRAVFRMLRLSLLMSVAIFGAVGIFFFFMPSVWSPPTRQWLEQKISSAFLGPAQIGDLRFTRLWPLTLSFRDLRVEGPALKMVLELEQFDIGLGASWDSVRLLTRARQGSLSLTTSPLVEAAWHMAKEEVAKSPQRTSYPADQLISQLPFLFDVKLENVALHHEDPRLPFPLHLDGLNAHLRSLDTSRLRVELKSNLGLPEKFFGLKVPVQVDLPELHLVEGGVKLPQGHLWIFGVGLEVHGEHAPGDRRYWEATLKPVDLARLPVLPEFLPKGEWRGPLKAQAKWRALGDKSLISGGFEAQGVQGQLDVEANGLKAKGSLKTSARVVIPESSGDVFPQIDFQLDGSALFLEFKSWLKKPASVPLQAFVKAAYDSGALTLHPSQFRLGPFVVVGRGRLEASDRGGFAIELKKTRLEGAESLFPMASGLPLSGAISANARVTQGGRGLENLSVQVESFKLEQVATAVRWPQQGPAWINGPVQISLESRGKWSQGKVSSAHGDFTLNLNQTELSYPKLAYKKKGWPLRVAGRAGMDGQNFQFSPLQVQLPKGLMSLRGRVGQENPRPLDLTFQVQGVRPQDVLSLWLESPSELTLMGSVDAAMALTGEFDSRLGMKSPVRASGNMAFSMAEVSWKSSSKAQQPSEGRKQSQESASGGPLIRGPLLPESPWARQSQVTLQGQVKKLEAGALRASGVALKGRLNKGLFQGDVSVQQIFAGSTQLRQVQLALLDPQIKTSFLLQAQGLKVGQFLKWILPEYAGRGDGLLSFKGQMSLPLVAVPQELSRLAGEISFQLEKGEMDSQWLLGRVTQSLKSKGLPIKVAPPSRLNFVSQGQGQIKSGEFHFAQWTIETSQKDQVVVKGKVGLDLQADLAGTIYLAQAPIGGAIGHANRDDQGRFVLPFVWKGSVLEPNLSIAESTVAALLKRTAEAEAKKFIKEKVEKNLRQSLDRELKKLLGN